MLVSMRIVFDYGQQDKNFNKLAR